MIEPSDLAAIDKHYFEVIGNYDYCITIRSMNSLNEWHLMERVANGHRTFVISHRHGLSKPYHVQRSRSTVADCCKYIKDHDAYYLEKIMNRRNRGYGDLVSSLPEDPIKNPATDKYR